MIIGRILYNLNQNYLFSWVYQTLEHQVDRHLDRLNVNTRVERFVSRYIAKAIYCIIWKHQKISRYLKVSRYFHDIFDAGFGIFWTFIQLQLDNLVVYLHM